VGAQAKTFVGLEDFFGWDVNTLQTVGWLYVFSPTSFAP